MQPNERLSVPTVTKRMQTRPARLVLPQQTEPIAAALLIHSWWGCDRSFTEYADRIAKRGIAVGLCDLFDGRTARTEADAMVLRAAPRAEPIYRGLLRDIAALRQATGHCEIAVIGFSMGAHWAVWLSQQPGNSVRRVVLYYGARGGNFAESRSEYLAHFAEIDPWVSATSRRGMASALVRAGRELTTYEYPQTGHWFAESARPDSYDKAAADCAIARTLDFLDCP